MTPWAFLKDGFVPDATAAVSIRDLTVQRGYGLFEFFKVEGGQPLFLSHHLERFYAGAEQMRLPLLYNPQQLTQIIQELIQKNKAQQAGIRLTLTGGVSADALQIGTPVLAATMHVITPPAPQQYVEGIKLITYPHHRQLPHIKTIDYLMAVWLQPLLQAEGADDFLYTHDGYITECPRANVFLVTKNDDLLTPDDEILEGITRGKVMELAATRKINVLRRPVSLADVQAAKEAFITSTTKAVLPVRQIDAHLFNCGSHTLTWQLLQAYRQHYRLD